MFLFLEFKGGRQLVSIYGSINQLFVNNTIKLRKIAV